jgi:hypothetical protein
MAKQVLTNVRYFVGPADLTAQSNKVELDDSMEEKDVTNFGSGGKKEVIAGLESVAISAEGFYQSGDPGYADDEWWTNRRTVEAHTVFPAPATTQLTAGDTAYLTQAVRLSAKLFGTVGDVATFALTATGAYPLARGACLLGPGTTVTTTGTGTAVNVGAVAAGKGLYASLHVVSISGTSNPTLNVKVQSDDNSGMTSATDVITFTAATAVGSQVARVAGAITDNYFRVSYTTSGTNPSFLAVVAVGIAAY